MDAVKRNKPCLESVYSPPDARELAHQQHQRLTCKQWHGRGLNLGCELLDPMDALAAIIPNSARWARKALASTVRCRTSTSGTR